MVRIRYIEDYGPLKRNKGDIANASKNSAANFVSQGVCEYVDVDKPQAPKLHNATKRKKAVPQAPKLHNATKRKKAVPQAPKLHNATKRKKAVPKKQIQVQEQIQITKKEQKIKDLFEQYEKVRIKDFDYFLFKREHETEKEAKKRFNKLMALPRIKKNMARCGDEATFDFFCKDCLSENKSLEESFLKTAKIILHCGIKYCDDPNCIGERFADAMERLEAIENFKELDKVLHMAIGFPHMALNDFEKGHKRQEYVMNIFLSKARKKGIKINAVKVLDISKGDRDKEWDGKYFFHYHLVIDPATFQAKGWRTEIIVKKRLGVLQQIRKDMIKNMRIKTPFHMQMFQNKDGSFLKKKKSVLSYIAIRSIGLYKPYESDSEDNCLINSTPKTIEAELNLFSEFALRSNQAGLLHSSQIKMVDNLDIRYRQKSIKEQLRDGKFMLLKDMFSIEDFEKLFYKRRFLSRVGELKIPSSSYCSKSRNNISTLLPKICRIHGELDRSQIKVMVTYAEAEGDPPNAMKKLDGHILLQSLERVR